jgi:hypothetical protein
MSPPSEGYESTRTVPGFHSTSQTSQHSRSHRFLNTHQSKVHRTLFSPTYTTQENGPPSSPHNPLGFPPPSRALVHLFKNIHARTLNIHICEKTLAHSHAYQKYRHQFMVGIHQQLLQPKKQWLISNNSFFSSKQRSK